MKTYTKKFAAVTLDEAKLAAQQFERECKFQNQWIVVGQQILDAGDTVTQSFFGDSVKSAIQAAKGSLPPKCRVISLSPKTAERFGQIAASAFTTGEAEELGREQLPKGAKIVKTQLTTAGAKGFLGLGKRPSQYNIEYFVPAEVELVRSSRPCVEVEIRPNTAEGFVLLEDIAAIWTFAGNWQLDSGASLPAIFLGKNVSLLEPIKSDRRFWDRLKAAHHFNLSSNQVAEALVAVNLGEIRVRMGSMWAGEHDFIYQKSSIDGHALWICTAVPGEGRRYDIRLALSLLTPPQMRSHLP